MIDASAPRRRELKQLHQIAQSNEYFECMTRVVARALQAPAAAIVTVGLERSELRSGLGLDDLGIADQIAFMASAVPVGEPLIVADLDADPRFRDHPLVAGTTHLRYYAGVALADIHGISSGALCVLDTQPRQLSPEDIQHVAATLQDLGGLIEHEMLMRTLTGSDPLTGLHTASYAMMQMEREWRRAQRGHEPITALVLDVDQLGRYNTVFGYPAGDRVLRRIAERLGFVFRRSGDMLVRLGGDRILALLPQTALDDALVIAEHGRQEIEQLQLGDSDNGVRITISIGAAGVSGRVAHTGGWQALLRRADDALRAAKRAGGNCIEVDRS